jgi:hypothetical protein
MDELFGVAGNVNPEEEAALAEIQAHRGQDDGARVNSPA